MFSHLNTFFGKTNPPMSTQNRNCIHDIYSISHVEALEWFPGAFEVRLPNLLRVFPGFTKCPIDRRASLPFGAFKMSCDRPRKRPRGAYKAYLKDSAVKIPVTTKWRHRKNMKNQHQTETSNEDAVSCHDSMGPEYTDIPEDESFQHIDKDYDKMHEDNSVQLEASVDRDTEDTDTCEDSARQSFEETSNEDAVSCHDSMGPAYTDIPEDESFQHIDKDYHKMHEDNSVQLEASVDRDTEDTDTCEDSARQSFEDDKPVYEGSRLTLAQSMLLLMMLYMKHGLTNEALSDILMVVELHCLAPNLLICTLKQFKGFFSKFKQHICFKYYCKFCSTYFGDEKDIPSFCDVCRKKTTQSSWFITVPIAEQMKALLQDDQTYNNIKKYRMVRPKQAGIISDVMDGRLYKNHFGEDGFFLNATQKEKHEEIHLSFQINTDGVSVFHSSLFGLWPVYIIINELDPKLRMHRKNRIFAGLWFGVGKPDFKTFMRPFAEELRSLYKQGFQFSRDGKTERIRCMLLSASLDSPAKCLFMEMTQFNGLYGCPCCLSPGETASTGGKGWCRVYPYNLDAESGHGLPRTHESALEHARAADLSGGRINGFKGTTWFMFLPKFDFVSGVAIDYMHQLLLGVTRQLVGIWFQKNIKEPYSLHKKTKEIDQRLLNIQPPNKLTRVPRALSENFSRFKAAEWRSFLLYYSLPCLYGILPEMYFQHFLLLVEAAHILLGASILHEDVYKSQRLLQHFCVQMQQLYGRRHESFNIHLLLHLPSKVFDLGPLWANSLFYFEDLNGELKHLFKGTQKIELQIIQGVCIQQQIPLLIKKVPDGSEVMSVIKKLERGVTRYNIKEEICTGIKIVGACNSITLTGKFFSALQRAVYRPKHISKFKRMYFFGTIIHSQSYKCVKKRNSYTISFDSQSGEGFGFVKFFLTVISKCPNKSVCSGRCLCNQREYYAMVEILQRTPQFLTNDNKTNATLSNIIPVKKTESVICVPVMKLKEMCIFVECGVSCFICKFPNSFEKD